MTNYCAQEHRRSHPGDSGWVGVCRPHFYELICISVMDNDLTPDHRWGSSDYLMEEPVLINRFRISAAMRPYVLRLRFVAGTSISDLIQMSRSSAISGRQLCVPREGHNCTDAVESGHLGWRPRTPLRCRPRAELFGICRQQLSWIT